MPKAPNWRTCRQCEWRYNHARGMTHSEVFCSVLCETKWLNDHPEEFAKRRYYQAYQRARRLTE